MTEQKKKILNEEELYSVIEDVQSYVSKKYNPSIIEWELIIRYLNELLNKKKQAMAMGKVNNPSFIQGVIANVKQQMMGEK